MESLEDKDGMTVIQLLEVLKSLVDVVGPVLPALMPIAVWSSIRRRLVQMHPELLWDPEFSQEMTHTSP